MLRLGLLIGVLALSLAPAALAQDEPDAVETPVAVATPPGCDRGPGTDADYAYCGDCLPESTDADYAYCNPCLPRGDDTDYTYACPLASSGGGPTDVKRKSAIRPLGVAAQALPMTGGSPVPIALFGLGLLMAGAGIRLRPASPPRRP